MYMKVSYYMYNQMLRKEECVYITDTNPLTFL